MSPGVSSGRVRRALAVCPRLPVLLAGLTCLVGQAVARPYGVEDLLSLESLGRVAVDPSGRWLVLETRAPYASAPRFDYEGQSAFALGRLVMVDLAHAGPARALLTAEPGTGYVAGPFSPSGRSMVVFQHREALWEAGVVTLATGRVRWLGVTPDVSGYGRTVQWRSETQLVLVALPAGDLPSAMGGGRRAMARLPSLWARTVRGVASALTVVGSGRYRADLPLAPAKRLLLLDLTTGDARELARGQLLDLELSADGCYAAVVDGAEPSQPKAADTVRAGDPGRRRDLIVVDLATGRIRHPLPSRDVHWSLLNWSPLTDSLLVYARDAAQPSSAGAFARVDLDAGTVGDPGDSGLQPTIDWNSNTGLTSVRGAWLGVTPALYGQPVGQLSEASQDWYRLDKARAVELGWRANTATAIGDGSGLVVTHGGDAWRMSVDGRRRLTSGGGWRLFSNPDFGIGARGALNPPRRPAGLWAVRNRPFGLDVQRLVGRPVRLHLSGISQVDQILAISDRALLLGRIDDHGVEALDLVRPGRAPLPILVLNGHLADVAVASPRPIVQGGPPGERRTSWLYLPPGYRSGQRLALVVMAYPGADYPSAPYSGRPDAMGAFDSPQVVAGHGYAVLVPSLPRVPSLHDPADGFTEQILQDVDRVVADGYVDPHRLALWGHSFGGYAAMVVATRTSRFAAIVAANGVSDLASMRGAFIPQNRVAPEEGLTIGALAGWAETGQGNLDATPWSDPDRYVRNSPVFFADRITTPLLLVDSDMDFVSLTQSEEMFSALWRQDKDVQLVTAWGEGHVTESPANIRALYAKAFAFLAPLIGPGEPSP